MANFKAKKLQITDINGGLEFQDGEIVSASAINAPINAALFAQSIATNKPKTQNANRVGTPNVYIEFNSFGEPCLVFENLKGIQGERGKTGATGGTGTSAILENIYGNSEANGYTQYAINRLVKNPNMLINGEFRVNQRGESVYTGIANAFCVDRWKLQESTMLFDVYSKTLTNTDTSNNGYMIQKFEDSNFLVGKTVTISAKIDGIVYNKTIESISIPENATSLGGVDFPKGRIYLYVYSNGTIGYVVQIHPNQSVIIEYAKMEMGEFCTDISPKDYGEELALCQRFFYRTKNKNRLSGLGNFCVAFSKQTENINNFSYSMYVPDMRTTPTVIFNGTIGLSFADKSYKINEENTTVVACYPNEIVFQTIIDETKNSQIAFVRSEFDFNSSFDFDAEIY